MAREQKFQTVDGMKTEQEILDLCSQSAKNTLAETLDIKIIEVGENYLIASMPVTSKVHQPDGVMHGGASAALAETVGSLTAYIFHNGKDFFMRGIEISVNHLKGVRSGNVFARAELLHNGRTTQLVNIKITNDAGDIVSSAKLTTIALPKK